MKYIFINLKRFDVPYELGGICPTPDPVAWIADIMRQSADITNVELVYFLPEALILPAIAHKPANVAIGAQGVYREDIRPNGNFGAFTSQFPATAAKNYGCTWAMIGHSEERKDKDDTCLNKELACASEAGLKTLYCVGEKAEELSDRYNVIHKQLEVGLRNVKTKTVIGYEPVWAIGPGKTPPGKEYISEISSFIKDTVMKLYGYEPLVVYGGGLKESNAKEIGSVKTIDGGLVALTRFEGKIGFYPSDLKRIIKNYLEV
ncbi:MAG: triose-phosphate isomerase family protein [Bacillota bacterium]